MKKIGILTTYFASNFGAMLQPFALKRHLENLGYDVEMIRYKQKPIADFYNPWKFHVLLSFNPRKIAGFLYNLPERVKRDRTFKRFMYKHINPEKGFCREIPNDKDFYFIGSDQIWNPKNTKGFDNIYFGNFNVKKDAVIASYAASAENIEYTKKQIEYLKQNIANFNFVSVREKVLEDNLRKVTGRQDICTVLDPSMLVDPKVYEEVDHYHPCPREKFIFFYEIRNCKGFAEKILNHAKSIGARL